MCFVHWLKVRAGIEIYINGWSPTANSQKHDGEHNTTYINRDMFLHYIKPWFGDILPMPINCKHAPLFLAYLSYTTL